MKKYLFAFIVGLLALTACEKEDDQVTAEAVTLGVSDVTAEQFTLSAKFTIKGEKETPCNYGIFVGDKPGLEHGSAIITENVYVSKPGSYDYSYVFNNQMGLLVPMYKFKPGTTVYYRAGIEVITAEGSTWYYGDEKKFLIPQQIEK